MNPQLVGPAGARPQFEPSPSVRGAANSVVGDRPLSGGVDDHPPTAASIELSEPGLDLAFGLGRAALDNRPIDFLHLSAGEQRPQPPQRLRVPPQHQAAAGIAIEPMGESRRVWQAEAQVVEPTFEIGPASGAGMHGNPGRLVDDENQTVAIEHPLAKPQTFAGSPVTAGPFPSPPDCGGRGRGPSRSDGRVRWATLLFGIYGSPHLTPTLSAPKGGEGDIPANSRGNGGVRGEPRAHRPTIPQRGVSPERRETARAARPNPRPPSAGTSRAPSPPFLV